MRREQELKEQFAQQQIVDVYISYDGPRVYSFFTPDQGFYFAFNLEQYDDKSEWLYVATNNFRLVQLLSKAETVRDFILKADAGYIVEIDNRGAVASLQTGFAEDKLPSASVYLKTDADYMTFYLTGDKISPFTMSESDFTMTLTTLRNGTLKAMKSLQGFLPSTFKLPSGQIFGAPMYAPGSLKMVVKVESDQDLLKATLAVASDQLADGMILNASQVDEVKNNFYYAAPPLRSRPEFSYDTVTITSNLMASQTFKLELNQNHKRKYLDYVKKGQRSDDMVILTGKVVRAAHDKCSFTIQDLENSEIVECVLDPNNTDLINDLSASKAELQSCESPEDIVTALLHFKCNIKVAGIISNASSIRVLKLTSALVVSVSA
jgi:hypothetical protein